MSFQQAIQSGFQNYANFQGRAGLSAFWYWVLFVVVVNIAMSFVGGILGGSILSLLVSLALIVPNIAVGARRLHDTGKSGWYQLAGLIPVLGWIYVIYLFVQPGDVGSNAFGDGPIAPPA